MSLRGRGIGLASVLVLAWGWALPAHAGILTTGAGFLKGTEHFAGSSSLGSLDANVDYAVYAPGNYPGTDPSSGHEFVYAYQIFALGDATLPLSTLTVGVAYDSSTSTNVSGGHNATYDPAYPDNTGAHPIVESLTPSSSSFLSLFAPGISPGGHSAILLFTSPNPPTFTSASVQNGGVSDQELLPSPIPEPGTLALAGIGAGLVLVRRRRA